MSTLTVATISDPLNTGVQFTASPKAPTPATLDNSTALATTAFVHSVAGTGASGFPIVIGSTTIMGSGSITSITGLSIDSSPIGSSAPSSGSFTTLASTGGTSLGATSAASLTTSNANISGGAINNTTIGATSPASIVGSSLVVSGSTTLSTASVSSLTITTTPAPGNSSTLGANTAFVQNAITSATGRLIAVRVFILADNGSTYTPTAGTTSVIVEAVGAGGGSGGTGLTTVSQVALGGPGGGGAYGKARFTSGFSGITLTIGAGGVAGTAGGLSPTNDGGLGGLTSFGSLLICPGGGNGQAGGGNTGGTSYINYTLTVAAAPTGANLISRGGTVGVYSYFATYGGSRAGQGGDTPLGSGGFTNALGGAVQGVGYGSGASGSLIASSTAATPGAAGQPGAIIVYEYA